MSDITFVDIYYLGGFVKADAIVSAKGNSYTVPPVGQSLRVPTYIAKDLIRRNRTPQGFSVFTTDKRMAEAIKNRKATSPTLSEKPAYSREQLLQMLSDMEAEDGPKVTSSKAKKETE